MKRVTITPAIVCEGTSCGVSQLHRQDGQAKHSLSLI